MPSVCADSTKWNELEKLIVDTRDALTYTNWLKESFEGACGGAAEKYRSILNDVDNLVTIATNERNKIAENFYEEMIDPLHTSFN